MERDQATKRYTCSVMTACAALELGIEAALAIADTQRASVLADCLAVLQEVMDDGIYLVARPYTTQ